MAPAVQLRGTWCTTFPPPPPFFNTHAHLRHSWLQDAIFKGNMTARFQNMLKPDAMVLGNHEFDFGSKFTASYVK